MIITPDVKIYDNDLFGVRPNGFVSRGNGWTPPYMGAVWYGNSGAGGYGHGDGGDVHRAEDSHWRPFWSSGRGFR